MDDSTNEFVNHHGVPVTTRRIFGWEELPRTHWDDGSAAEIVSGEEMHLIRAEMPPGCPYEMHSHPHEQFSLMLSGQLRLTVGDETRDIGPGEGWYAPANVPHGGEVLGDESAIFIDVYSPATRWILDIFDEGETRT